jgi:hypothetical protein
MRRQPTNYELCLVSFSRELKREIKESLAAWRTIEPKLAQERRQAYESVVFLLRQQAAQHEVPLTDLGLVDYAVPKVERSDA